MNELTKWEEDHPIPDVDSVTKDDASWIKYIKKNVSATADQLRQEILTRLYKAQYKREQDHDTERIRLMKEYNEKYPLYSKFWNPYRTWKTTDVNMGKKNKRKTREKQMKNKRKSACKN